MNKPHRLLLLLLHDNDLNDEDDDEDNLVFVVVVVVVIVAVAAALSVAADIYRMILLLSLFSSVVLGGKGNESPYTPVLRTVLRLLYNNIARLTTWPGLLLPACFCLPPGRDCCCSEEWNACGRCDRPYVP